MIQRLEHLLTRCLEALLILGFLFLLALVVIQVFLRYVLNTSITGANEVIIILFVYTTAIGGAIAAGRREHIALTFAIDWLPSKARHLVDQLGLFLVAAINAIMVWFSFHWISITGDYLMPSTGLPRIVAQLSIPLGCGLATLYCLTKVFTLKNDKEVAS